MANGSTLPLAYLFAYPWNRRLPNPTKPIEAGPMTFDRLRDTQPTVLLSARHRKTGQWRTVHGEARFVPMGKGARPGSILEAVADAIAKLEVEPGPWEVTAISYPGRILQDLRPKTPFRKFGNMARTPERYMLGRLKRRDLIPGTGRQSNERR